MRDDHRLDDDPSTATTSATTTPEVVEVVIERTRRSRARFARTVLVAVALVATGGAFLCRPLARDRDLGRAWSALVEGQALPAVTDDGVAGYVTWAAESDGRPARWVGVVDLEASVAEQQAALERALTTTIWLPCNRAAVVMSGRTRAGPMSSAAVADELVRLHGLRSIEREVGALREAHALIALDPRALPCAAEAALRVDPPPRASAPAEDVLARVLADQRRDGRELLARAARYPVNAVLEVALLTALAAFLLGPWGRDGRLSAWRVALLPGLLLLPWAFEYCPQAATNPGGTGLYPLLVHHVPDGLLKQHGELEPRGALARLAQGEPVGWRANRWWGPSLPAAVMLGLVLSVVPLLGGAMRLQATPQALPRLRAGLWATATWLLILLSGLGPSRGSDAWKATAAVAAEVWPAADPTATLLVLARLVEVAAALLVGAVVLALGRAFPHVEAPPTTTPPRAGLWSVGLAFVGTLLALRLALGTTADDVCVTARARFLAWNPGDAWGTSLAFATLAGLVVWLHHEPWGALLCPPASGST